MKARSRQNNPDSEDVENAWTGQEVLITFLGASTVFLMGGLIFGFNSLKPIMYEAGVFESACTEFNATASENGVDHGAQCPAQTTYIDLIYDLAIFNLRYVCRCDRCLQFGRLTQRPGKICMPFVGASFIMIFFGTLQDKYGARKAGLVAVLTSGIGIIMLGFGNDEGIYWMFSFFLLGGFNCCVFMCIISLTKTVPQISAWFTSFCLGLFDMSAFVFFAFQQVHSHFGVKFWKICGAYAILAVGTALCVLPYLPQREDNEEIQKNYDKVRGKDTYAAEDHENSQDHHQHPDPDPDPDQEVGQSNDLEKMVGDHVDKIRKEMDAWIKGREFQLCESEDDSGIHTGVEVQVVDEEETIPTVKKIDMKDNFRPVYVVISETVENGKVRCIDKRSEESPHIKKHKDVKKRSCVTACVEWCLNIAEDEENENEKFTDAVWGEEGGDASTFFGMALFMTVFNLKVSLLPRFSSSSSKIPTPLLIRL